MDPDLLTKTTEATNRLDEQVEAAHEADERIEYRDLKIDEPQLPLRIKFDPPLEFDGEKYPQLVFDFDSLIGKDFQRAERTFNRMYKAEKNETVLMEMKHLYHCILAAQVADVPIGVIFKLPRRFYTPLRLECLKACGSSPDETTP